MMTKYSAALLVFALSVLVFSGCGEVVEQDKIVLEFKLLGNRTVSIQNMSDKELKSQPVQMLTARRLAIVRTGIKYVIFPRGNQMYRFTKLPSIESPTNEEFTINALDGNIKFDVVVQLHINTEYPDIRERLIRFCTTFDILRYAGNPNALGMFVSEKLRPKLQQAFQNQMTGKPVLELCRNKTAINEAVLSGMNDQFNQYGLAFTLIGINSAFTFDESQQKRMNDIVNQEIQTRVVQIENTKILPLDREIAQLEREGDMEASIILNNAEAQAMQIRAQAWNQRRQLVASVVGTDKYLEWEKVKSFSAALSQSEGKAKILPPDRLIIIGQ